MIYLHREGIVHRDLRLNNILYDGKKVKIDDFQKAIELKPYRFLNDITGNPNYVAPEILKGKYNHSIDVWALGVILYHMVFHKYPFIGKNTEDTVNKIQNPEFYPDFSFNSKLMTTDSRDVLNQSGRVGEEESQHEEFDHQNQPPQCDRHELFKRRLISFPNRK